MKPAIPVQAAHLPENMVQVRELIAWGLDNSAYRTSALPLGTLATAQAQAQHVLCSRPEALLSTAFMQTETAQLAPLFAPLMQRDDLLCEFAGLDWSMGVVDLRCLLTFQRRLTLDPAHTVATLPHGWSQAQPCNAPLDSSLGHDWSALLALAAGSSRNTDYTLVNRNIDDERVDILLTTTDSNLCVRVDRASAKGLLPLSLHGGSPFFEVAEFRDRWFLRDGYHRAFHLLRAGIHTMIAVIVRARSLEETGANHPLFFGEDVLFSSQPPLVTDFLCNDLTVCYCRPRLTKTIHIRIEQSWSEEDHEEENCVEQSRTEGFSKTLNVETGSEDFKGEHT